MQHAPAEIDVQAWSSARRVRSADAVAQVLWRRILLGGFEPGEKLPTERELAAAMDVSRNTVREAVRALAADGVVETTVGRNGGSRVSASTHVGSAVRREITEQFRRSLRSHMEYRRVIEPAAAALAAMRADEAQLTDVRNGLGADVTDLATYHRADTGFHLAVAAAAGNPVLLTAVADARAALFADTNVLWLKSDWGVVYGDTTSFSAVFREEHAEIARAIDAGDPDAARAAMDAHLADSLEQFEALLRELGRQ